MIRQLVKSVTVIEKRGWPCKTGFSDIFLKGLVDGVSLLHLTMNDQFSGIRREF